MTVLHTILLLSTVTSCVSAHVFSDTNISTCSKDVREMQAIAVSQDTLYNIALGTCVAGTMIDWHFQNSYAAIPPRIAAAYSLQSSARVHCATTRVTCSIALPGALSSVLPHVQTHTDSITCLRGAHIYSMWTITQQPIFQSLVLMQDITLDPAAHRARVRTASDGEITWPFSLIQTAIFNKVISTAEDASHMYMHELCKDHTMP